jgi:hypothetical protein
MNNLMILQCNQADVKKAIAALNKPEAERTPYEKKKEALMKACASREEMIAYAAARTDVIDLNIKAKMIGTQFFQTRTLKGAELPQYITKGARANIPVYYLSTYGGNGTMVYSNTQGIVDIPLNFLATDKVKSPKASLFYGNVDFSEEINEELAYNMLKQLDSMAWTALNTAFGAFDSNVMLADSLIKDLPTTNDIDLSDVCAGKITPDLYKAILKHFYALGKIPYAVYIPSARAADHLDWVSIIGTNGDPSKTIAPDVQAEIWRSGGLNMGASWIPKIVPTNMLDGTTLDQIYVYVISTEPVGFFYEKPELHTTVVDDREPLFYEHYELRTGAFVVPAPLRVNIARFKLG